MRRKRLSGSLDNQQQADYMKLTQAMQKTSFDLGMMTQNNIHETFTLIAVARAGMKDQC